MHKSGLVIEPNRSRRKRRFWRVSGSRELNSRSSLGEGSKAFAESSEAAPAVRGDVAQGSTQRKTRTRRVLENEALWGRMGLRAGSAFRREWFHAKADVC